MRDITILREGDLPYFEELEKEGKAVILRFPSLSDLASFDLASFLQESEEKMPTEDDIRKWIMEEQERIQKEQAKLSVHQEKVQHCEDAVEMYFLINNSGFTREQHRMLMALVDMGMSKARLQEIASPFYTDAERLQMIRETAKELSGTNR